MLKWYSDTLYESYASGVLQRWRPNTKDGALEDMKHDEVVRQRIENLKMKRYRRVDLKLWAEKIVLEFVLMI